MDEKYVRTLVQTNENDEFVKVARDYTNDIVLSLAREIERLRARLSGQLTINQLDKLEIERLRAEKKACAAVLQMLLDEIPKTMGTIKLNLIFDDIKDALDKLEVSGDE